MDDQCRRQVRLILTHLGELARTELDNRIKGIYSEHAAKGLLGSGATIKRTLQEMEEIVAKFISNATDQVAPVAKDIEAFSLIQEASENLQSAFQNKIDSVVEMATGHGRFSGKDDAAYAGTDSRFRGLRGRLLRQLELHRFSFTEPAQAPAPNVSAELPRTLGSRPRGGRPLAAHWDEMWAAVAVMLYIGDLKPRSQAEIERAMKDWFADRNLEVGDTAVRDRARPLWRALEESD